MVKTRQWSSLSLISEGDTWFRDPAVYRYFDRLVDDRFFEGFDEVLFFGAGPCGYAAAAFSVCARVHASCVCNRRQHLRRI